jgi:hypothetical protein
MAGWLQRSSRHVEESQAQLWAESVVSAEAGLGVLQRPGECLGRTAGRRPRPGVTAQVHLQRVAHAEGDAAGIDAQLVGPQAVAVAEGVGHGPFLPRFQPLAQVLPSATARRCASPCPSPSPVQPWRPLTGRWLCCRPTTPRGYAPPRATSMRLPLSISSWRH